MKSGLKLAVVFLVMIYVTVLNAATLTATKDGDWTDPTVWSTGTIPVDGDEVIIPAGFVVEVSGINGTVFASLIVTVDGELNLDNGQKLRIDCDSYFGLSGSGVLSGDNGGSKLVVCGVDEYAGTAGMSGPASYGRSPLPIELISFTAEIKNEKHVELLWKTATETNNDFFTIEKSKNGVSYDEVSTTKGAGNSTSALSYSYVDENPLEGTSYYRLKQTDFDGKFEYSSMIAVNFEKTSTGCVLKVYPNPCSSECKVDLVDCDDNEKPDINVELIDAGGQRVYSNVPVRDEKGEFSFSIDANNNLKPGVYIVRGVSKKENYTKKIIVK